MKKHLLSALIGLSFAGQAAADNLKQVYELALLNDPTYLRAAANVDINKETARQALGDLLPQLSLSSSYTRSHNESANYLITESRYQVIDRATTSLSHSVSLSQPLFRWDLWKALKIGNKQEAQAITDFELSKQDLLFRVANSYFDVLRQKDAAEFSKAELKAVERQLEQTKQRYQVGLTAITDVHEAQSQYDNAVARDIQANVDLINAKETLREITGQFHQELDVLNTDKFSTNKPQPEGADAWQTQAEERSLQLRSRRMGMEIAREQIGQAQAGHMPSLSLSASYGKSKSTGDDTVFFNGDTVAPYEDYTDNNSVGVTLSVPLYLGGNVSSRVRQAEASYVAASEDMHLTHRSVVRNTRSAYNNVVASISSIKALEQSVVSAGSALQSTEAGFEVGTRTIVDVLNGTRDLYNAKRNLANARYNYIINVLSLKQAAGVLSPQDLDDINAGLAN